MANVRYYVDWNNDGSFGGTYDEITDHVIHAEFGRGRDYASTLRGHSTAGQCTINLRNIDSRFSSFNSGSPIYGKILPGRSVKITITSGGTESTVWQGDLVTIVPSVGLVLNEATATLTANGVLARNVGQSVTIPMQTGIKTGAAIAAVLDAAGFPASKRVIDTGQSTLVRFWTGKTTAAQALRDIEDTEVGFIRESRDGKIVFEDRHHRYAGSHATSQATYTNHTDGTLRYQGIDQADPLDNVFNLFEAEVRTFDHSEDMVLWTLSGDPPLLTKDDPLVIKAKFQNSSYLAVHEWGMIDYWANSDAGGTGTDLTEYVTVTHEDYDTECVFTVTLTGAGAPSTAYLTLLRAHGTAVVEGDPAIVTDLDQDSRDKYGDRLYQFDGKYIANIDEAKAFLSYFKSVSKEPVPMVTLRVAVHSSDAHLAEARIRDVSDRITIVADSGIGLYINGDFFVERILHSVDFNGQHYMTLVCSSAELPDEWGDSSPSYTPKVIPSPSVATPHVPDDLEIAGFSFVRNGNVYCNVTGRAWKWNDGIDQAEIRAKRFDPGSVPDYVDLRTEAEGGTFADNAADQRIFTGLWASYEGCNQGWQTDDDGTWYVAFRIHNAEGWSVWSDGNDTPLHVKDKFDTVDAASAPTDGPPADWDVTMVEGPTPYTVVVSATRPRTNGQRLTFCGFQIRTTGDWLDVDSATSPSAVYYDGSAISHTYDPATRRISRNSGQGFGTAKIGDMVVLDVRNAPASWDVNHCVWFTFQSAEGLGDNPAIGTAIPSTATYIQLRTPIYLTGLGGTTNDLRLKIVNGPWGWTSGGYFGAYPGYGLGAPAKQPFETQLGGDTTTQVFTSLPISYPSNVEFKDLYARANFQNTYSRSFGGSGQTGGAGGPLCVTIADASPIATNAALAGQHSERLLIVSVDGDRTLDNPENAVCGQILKWRIINTSSSEIKITLADKFRVGQAFPEFPGPFNIVSDDAYDEDWLAIGKGGGMFLLDGAPESSSFAGVAGPGALLIDRTHAEIYINTGTKASPTWSRIGQESQTHNRSFGFAAGAAMTLDATVT